MSSTLTRIFQNKNLTLLWLGQMASQSGDSVFQIGLLWLALELSGSEAVTGLVAMAAYLPAVLLALAAGVVADRGDRRRIMLTADAFRAAAILLIPAAALFWQIQPALLAAVAFGLAIAATFFNPARDALIPQIVPRGGLLRANSLIQTSWQFSLLIGPAIAGALLHWIGKIHLFTADALLYAASFGCVFWIRSGHTLPPLQFPPGNRGGEKWQDAGQSKDQTLTERADLSLPPAPRGGKQGGEGSPIRQIADGLTYVLHQPVILPLLLITIADNIFIMGPAIVGTPVLIRNELRLGADAYALIMACYAVGMLIGTAALLTWGKSFGKGKILLVGMVLDGITFIPLYYVHSLTAMGAVIVVHSLAIPMLTVTRAALIQSLVPPQLTGRVFALVNLAVVGMSALSSGAAGIALEAWGSRAVFLAIGIGGGICGVIGWLFARELRRAG